MSLNPYIFSLLLMSLGLGTTLTFLSSHWLMAWMGLEISTLSIIPLLAKQNHPRAVEATTKYFLIQAAATATLLFATLSNAWFTGQWNITELTHPLLTSIVILSLALKLGLAPLHGWLPEVLQGLDLSTGLIISTWQKLAPFALLVQISLIDSFLIIFIGLVSILVGGWGGLNQTQLRKVLAYSSIGHLGWMAIVVQFSTALTLLMLAVYLVMTTALFMVFNMNKTVTTKMLASSASNPVIFTIATPLLFLSLAGLPPLMGFMPKLLILKELMQQEFILLAIMIAMSALLAIYFYLRLIYVMAMTTFPLPASAPAIWRKISTKWSVIISFLISSTIMAMPLFPLIYAVISYFTG
uniref:NADH-ubiquinone oxidoreductase chain 2 n=1 Tax=Lobotes surinamensis TaxID=463596 RepID=A0A0B6VLT7_9TELE|nr:NADH dehydrogenase subunit 2 [Lobotes surinamensis]BAQ20839.1 NADH dehydrogenase subunit 2 [Lobotes surinamensis]